MGDFMDIAVAHSLCDEDTFAPGAKRQPERRQRYVTNKTKQKIHSMAKTNKPAGRPSLADLWDDTDPSEATNTLPNGTHEVRINKIELKEDKKKGEAAILEVEGLEGDIEGLKGRQLYKLRDVKGGKGPGLAYLMRDLALLGYEKITGAKLKKTLKEISDEQPMVVVNAKENGAYVNIYIQGLVGEVKGADDDGEEDDAASSDIEEGDTVTWDNDGDDVKGKVTKINEAKGVATVQPIDDDGDDDGKPVKVDLEDLTKVDEDADGDDSGDGDDAESEPIAEDDFVTFEDDDDNTVRARVISVNEKKETAKVQPVDDDGDDDGKAVTKDLSDLTKEDADAESESSEEEEEEDEKPAKKGKAKKWTPAVGDEVKWTDDEGDEQTGTIKKIKGDTATIEDADEDVEEND
jgi:hypothetical protein